MYDQALITWINDTLVPELPGRDVQLLISTPMRRYADVLSGKLCGNNTLKTPRIAITRMDHANDPARYNSYTIRRLGACGNNLSRFRQARFPAPILVPYQVDVWTRKVAEMNQVEQKVLFDFASELVYLSIRPDDVWQDKKYATFLDGPIADNSELEPGDERRAIRRSISLRCECWMFDQVYIPVPVVKSFEIQVLDADDLSLYDTYYTPPIEVLATGDGSQTVFGPFTLLRPEIVENTVVVRTVIGGSITNAQDNGLGVLFGDHVSSGSVNYVTGELSITFSTAPDNGEDISVTYFMDVEA
jgi:hypothetical protein